MMPPRSPWWTLIRSLPPSVWVKAAVVVCLLVMASVIGFFMLLAGIAGLAVAALVGWMLPPRRDLQVPEAAPDWRRPDDPRVWPPSGPASGSPGNPQVIETDYTVVEDRPPRDKR